MTKQQAQVDNAPSFFQRNNKAISFIATAVATAALLKHKGYSCAFCFYSRGGGGINVYKRSEDHAKPQRRFAIDYHPIWNKQSKTNEYRLHYHRGKHFNEIRKHRPYDGQW